MGEPRQFTLQEYFSPAGRTRRFSRFPGLVREAVALVNMAAPRDLRLCAALQALIGATLAVQLLLIRSLLGALFATTEPDFADLVPELAALAALGIVQAGAGTILSVRERILGQLVALHATDAVVRTATGVDLITYDEPGFHDRLQRAQMSAGSRPALLVTGLLGLGGSLLAIAGIVIALVIIEPLFCALALVAYIPAWIATNFTSRLVYRFSVEQAERERRRMYLYDLLTTKEPAQEVRAFDLGRHLGDQQRTIYAELIEQLRSVLHHRLRISLAAQTGSALLAAAVMALLVWFVTSGRMALSEAGAATGAMIVLTTRLRALAGSAGGLYESSLYLHDYSTFVAAAPRIEAARPTRPAPADPQVVTATGVGFTYPSRSEPSLTDVSLELRRGEVVALVGENGSGKTTLAKLLAGLYTAGAGTVAWDGVDLRELDPVTMRPNVAVIFQDFVRYQLPAHDNVALGDSRHAADREAVERAARAAGMDEALSALPAGYDTLLGPEFYGGSNLSGGQWQRLALARAFFRDAPIVILDEPTAALDPRAEAEIYDRMGELFSGRAVLLISHRFGSVRSADRIYVLRGGHVHEEGSHDELMAARGYYAELFSLQANQYVG